MSYPRKFLNIFILIPIFLSFTLVEDLADPLSGLEEGDQLLLEYSFEGCYGPYHHGTIRFSVERDTVYYLEKSFDDKGKQGISQSGQYSRTDLLSLLVKSKNKKSREIFGNTITYRVSLDGNELVTGADRIEQSHFIEIFHPFSSVFPLAKESVIPGLKTGGFVH